MDSYTDDELIGFYETAIGPLHNPSPDWLADALVWLRRIVTAASTQEAATAASMWTGETPREMAEFAEQLRAAAGKAAPPPEPAAAADSRIVHVNDIQSETIAHGHKYSSQYRSLSMAAGGVKLGCSLYEVAPGKRAFPFHAHYGIEEAIFILSGEGTLRLGAEEFQVRAGTYTAFPPGPDAAHQLINTGSTTLRYLCLSSGSDPEVVIYPDTGKVMALAGGWPPKIRLIGREADNLGYWDDE